MLGEIDNFLSNIVIDNSIKTLNYTISRNDTEVASAPYQSGLTFNYNIDEGKRGKF
jgi:hypothetical protein